MAYATRSRSRRTSGGGAGARWMDLRYAGRCAVGGEELPAGTRAFYDPADRTVCCTDLEHATAHGVTEERWQGSPTSGGYVTVLAADRVGGRRGTRRGGYRCEDAPCCGCCD